MPTTQIMEKSVNPATNQEKIMSYKSKRHYFYHTNRRYEDEKFKERFAFVGLIIGGVIGGCAGGIIGAIFGALVGVAVIGFIGHVIATFR